MLKPTIIVIFNRNKTAVAIRFNYHKEQKIGLVANSIIGFFVLNKQIERKNQLM